MKKKLSNAFMYYILYLNAKFSHNCKIYLKQLSLIINRNEQLDNKCNIVASLVKIKLK